MGVKHSPSIDRLFRSPQSCLQCLRLSRGTLLQRSVSNVLRFLAILSFKIIHVFHLYYAPVWTLKEVQISFVTSLRFKELLDLRSAMFIVSKIFIFH